MGKKNCICKHGIYSDNSRNFWNIIYSYISTPATDRSSAIRSGCKNACLDEKKVMLDPSLTKPIIRMSWDTTKLIALI